MRIAETLPALLLATLVLACEAPDPSGEPNAVEGAVTLAMAD